MLRWLGSLHAVVLFALFAVVGIGVTLLFDAVMRRYVNPETRERASSTASVTLQVTATIYAILIAFVIVDAYTQIRSTQQQISTKAANLSIIFENSRAIPDPAGQGVRRATLAYTRAILDDGFPRLADTGEASPISDDRLEDLFATVRRVEPTTLAQRAAYTATLGALDNVVSTKEQLISSAGPTIPNSLLLMLFVIGLTVMAVATLLDTRHRRSHLFILSSLALVIWITLALVVSLDYPFSGTIRATDTPVREFLDQRAAR